MVRKGMLDFSTPEVLLLIACVGSVLQVVMFLSNTSDPFTHVEKAVAAVLFREPTEKANTSDSKKKKEWTSAIYLQLLQSQCLFVRLWGAGVGQGWEGVREHTSNPYQGVLCVFT